MEKIMCDPILIEEMKLAVDAEKLPTQFTVTDIKEWIKKENIKKPDGTSYPEISLELVIGYTKHIPITKKRKRKVLYASSNGRLFSFCPF